MLTEWLIPKVDDPHPRLLERFKKSLLTDRNQKRLILLVNALGLCFLLCVFLFFFFLPPELGPLLFVLFVFFLSSLPPEPF